MKVYVPKYLGTQSHDRSSLAVHKHEILRQPPAASAVVVEPIHQRPGAIEHRESVHAIEGHAALLPHRKSGRRCWRRRLHLVIVSPRENPRHRFLIRN